MVEREEEIKVECLIRELLLRREVKRILILIEYSDREKKEEKKEPVKIKGYLPPQT